MPPSDRWSAEETIARMLCARETPWYAWEELNADMRTDYLESAARIIGALDEQGHRFRKESTDGR